MTRTHRFTIIDVFTDTPLAGNQLGVFTDARGLTPQQMQDLARELGFSECAFVLPPEGEGKARIRIFTPTHEVPFAGHPVLGAAFVLGVPLQATLLKLETGAGVVPVLLHREGARIIFANMSQPIPAHAPFDHAEELLEALGVGGSELPVEVYDNGVRHVFVALDPFAAVAAVRPDGASLAALGSFGVNVFATEGGGPDSVVRVKTRMFAPALGIAEDAATGSAAGPLAVHLARHGRIGWGDEIEIAQGAEIGRPSTLYARAEGDASAVTGVEVGGSARIVARGEFIL